MEQMIYNEYGEPIGTEYVREPWEEEIAEWEENMHRAEDPLYAASQEDAMWLARAHAAFEEQDICVPHEVEEILAKEMRKKARKHDEEMQLAKAQPFVDLLNSMIDGCGAYAVYQPETIDEIAYTFIAFNNIKAVTKEALNLVYDAADKAGIEYGFIEI